MVNFGLLTAEIGLPVWGTPANFNGLRVLVALLHGTLVMSASQALRRWTEGATYIRQGGHHHILVSSFFLCSCLDFKTAWQLCWLVVLIFHRFSMSSLRQQRLRKQLLLSACQHWLRTELLLARERSVVSHSIATKQRTMHNDVDIHREKDACWQHARPAKFAVSIIVAVIQVLYLIKCIILIDDK